MTDTLETILSQNPRFDGIKITLAGHEVTVPSMNLRQIKQYGKEMVELQKKSDIDIFDRMASFLPMICDVLNRNYPGLTTEHLEDVLDMGNFTVVFQAAMNASDIRGEKKPVAAVPTL